MSIPAVAAAIGVLAQPSLAAPSSASACTAHRVTCMTVTVPLDRTGAVPGTVPLHVEVLPNASGPRRGVIILVAGGPGQGSAGTFDLGDSYSAAFFRAVFPGYTLVAYDDRGTGASGLLDCPTLDRAAQSVVDATALVTACADSLGPARDFYGTADHVEDLDAVRQALGVTKIAIYGVSYGTKLALEYASAHPDHVERLLLDSVVPLDRPDPFATDELRAMPTTLAAYCANRSCPATSDFAGDVVALANALAAAPLTGQVLTASGRTTRLRLEAADFLDLVFSADLSPGLAAELPAAVHAARSANARPLLRLYELSDAGDAGSVGDMSEALYLATTCDDGPFPWQPTTPLGERPQTVQSALAAPPGDWFGPFGSWAESFGSATTCLGWPSMSSGTTLALHPPPDVPVLALGGGLDLRTPTSWAASVIAQFPHGHLLVVPGVGHSVLTMDPSGCSQRAVRDWLLGATPPGACPRGKPLVTPVGAYPTSVPAHLDRQQMLSLAGKTLHDAEAVWLLGDGTKLTAPGLYGGQLVAHEAGVVLRHYAIAPGFALTGTIRMAKVGPPVTFSGRVTVSGAKAAGGVLLVANNRITAPRRHR